MTLRHRTRGLSIRLFAAALIAWRLNANAQTWQEALAKMPVPSAAQPLTRKNFIPVCLDQFRSNGVIKTLIFLPGVADDFYLINRDRTPWRVSADTLLAALTGLTNATQLHITSQPPYLLVHADRDRLTSLVRAKDGRVGERFRSTHSITTLALIDRHWDAVQPALQNGLKMPVIPLSGSEQAWHFGRVNLAASGLTDWELLSALSIASRTKVVIESKKLRFEEALDAFSTVGRTAR
jgi:hypothetical protein